MTDFGTVVLIREWPHVRNGGVHWRSKLLQILQEVRGIGKTRNHLTDRPKVAEPMIEAER
jgi:hypothetical protein